MELGEPDDSGRRRPIPIKDSEYIIPADAMIAAVAQAPEISFLEETHGLEVTPKGTFAEEQFAGDALAVVNHDMLRTALRLLPRYLGRVIGEMFGGLGDEHDSVARAKHTNAA